MCGFSPCWIWNRWNFASNILHTFYGVMVRYWNLHLHLLLPLFPWHSPQTHRHMTVLYTPALGKLSNTKYFNIQRLLRPWKKIRYSTTEGISRITFIRVVDKAITWAHCYECLYYCNVWRLVKPTTSHDKCHLTQEIQRDVLWYCKLLLIVFVCSRYEFILTELRTNNNKIF